MTVVLALADAQAHLSDLIDHVVAGEEIIVVRAGQPVARLLPMEPVVPEAAAGARMDQEPADQVPGERQPPRRLERGGLADPAAVQEQWMVTRVRS